VTDRPLVVVADDLTGAADTAAAFAAHAGPVPLSLASDRPLPAGAVVAVDTDGRATDATTAGQRTAAVVAAARAGGRAVYLKVDSTGRGHLAATVAAAAAGAPGEVVVCTAFPALGRRVAGGVVHGPSGPRTDLRAVLATIPRVRVADAATDEDLAALVAATAPGVTWVGSAGLARHVAARLPAPTAPAVPSAAPDVAPATVVAVVAGSQQHTTAAQLRHVAAAAASLHRIDPRDAAQVAAAVEALRGVDALVLTGGHTARAVLAGLGLEQLTVQGEVETGIPWSTASLHGRTLTVVTKAGGFGDEHSLARAVAFLRSGAAAGRRY
jgi:4-hydroxythreonine-4-phosphate dehydrogenase